MKNLRDCGLNTANKVYMVAEIGLNHRGDLDLAKELIDSAAKTGVDAVKFQTYITEKRVVKDSPIFDILKKCELPFRVFRELKEHAAKYKLDFFSTAFDEDSVDCLERINVNIYKIASFDVVNHRLLNRIAETKKTVILSVGMANLAEIRQAYDILHEKTNKIALLHCISAYPTKEEDANLAAIHTLKKHFDCIIGQSDHTANIEIPLYAVIAGAQIIEKHYRISADMECIDAPVSVTETEMKKMVNDVRRLEKILGDGEIKMTKAQQGALIFRRYDN